MAVGHLLSLGYRRIATITGPLSRAWAADRLTGYKQALAEHGMAVEQALIVESRSVDTAGYRGMMHLLQLTERPDAVFIPGETITLGAVQAIREKGLGVPHDIGIVSYDDFVPGLFGDIRMSTVIQPIKETAEAAVDLLIERIDEPERPPVQKVLPVQLVVRDSCGAALHTATRAGKEVEQAREAIPV